METNEILYIDKWRPLNHWVLSRSLGWGIKIWDEVWKQAIWQHTKSFYASSSKAIVFKQKVILNWAILMRYRMTWYVAIWLVFMLHLIFQCHSSSFLTRLNDLEVFLYQYIIFCWFPLGLPTVTHTREMYGPVIWFPSLYQLWYSSGGTISDVQIVSDHP